MLVAFPSLTTLPSVYFTYLDGTFLSRSARTILPGMKERLCWAHGRPLPTQIAASAELSNGR